MRKRMTQAEQEMTHFVTNSTPQGNDHLPPALPRGLIRRIRRHVGALDHTFFAVTAPGIELLCQKELMAMGISRDRMRMVAGGVEFDGRLVDGYSANLYLSTANRVLMRIGEFKATGFAPLVKKAAAVAWELYLYPGFRIDISVTAKHSRLIHTDAIAERITQAIASRLGDMGPSHPIFDQRLFVRVVNDHFTLSIDASGAGLYKRGIKTHGGRAPLRETGAAAILKIVGYRPGMALLDPMCGAGTFAIEAAMIARNIPPGWFRTFAFMGWPCYRPRQWAYLRREAQAGFTMPDKATIIASDKNAPACQRLSESLAEHGLTEGVHVLNKDFFDLSPSLLMGQYDDIDPGVIVFNPPYGKRLGTRKDSSVLIRAVCEKLLTDFSGWRFALLAPRHVIGPRFPLPCNTRPFHHGGLKLILLTGKV